MAVNDLMMRIQLLVDSGRSSAQLGRVQKSLADLTKQLDSLKKTKLDLKEQINDFKELDKQVKRINFQNFTNGISEAEKAFRRFNLQTQSLTDLRKKFGELDFAKQKQQINDFAGSLQTIEKWIREVKRFSLKDALDTPAKAQAELAALNNQLKQANATRQQTIDTIRAERQAIIELNTKLGDSANLYAQKRITDDPNAKSWKQLNDALKDTNDYLSLLGTGFAIAKDNITTAKNALKALREESKNLSKKNIFEFGIKDGDIAQIQQLLGANNKIKIDVRDIEQARQAYFDLNKEVKDQKQLLKNTKAQVPATFDDLQKAKQDLRDISITIAQNNRDLANQKKLRADALLLTDDEVKRIQQLRSANAVNTNEIRLFKSQVFDANQLIKDYSQNIRDIKLNASLAKGLQLPDQANALNQFKSINQELKNLDVNKLAKIRSDIRQLQTVDGVESFIDSKGFERSLQSINSVTQAIRNLRQQLRTEGRANLIDFKDSSGQARNLIDEVTTLKNRMVQLKQFSAGDFTQQVFRVDENAARNLQEQIKLQGQRNTTIKDAYQKIEELEKAFTNYHAAAKAGDAVAKKNISTLITEYNKLNKELGLGASGLQVNIKTETATQKINDLSNKITDLVLNGGGEIRRLKDELTNIKPIVFDEKIALSGLNRIQQAIRDIKTEQQALKFGEIAPLDAQTKVYDKQREALRLLREEIRKYTDEDALIGKGKGSTEELERRRANIQALRKEFQELVKQGKFSGQLFEEIFKIKPSTDLAKLGDLTKASIDAIDLKKLKEQTDLLERQSVFGKLNSAILSQQNAERGKELATLVKQEAIGKNNIANAKADLEAINQLITAERNRAKIAAERIKSGDLNTRLAELNSLKDINEELKASLRNERERRTGLRETARLLLEQGKMRAFDFTNQLPDLQRLVNAQRQAKNEAEANVNALKQAIQIRKDEIGALEQQKKTAAEVYQREIDRLNAIKATNAATKAQRDLAKQEQTNLFIQQQQKIDLDITAAKKKLDDLQNSYDASKKSLEDLIKVSQQSAKEAENLAKADIAGRKQSIQQLDNLIQKIRERKVSDQEAIKAYQDGLKDYEKGVRSQIKEAQLRIASNQLTKQQHEEERKGINDLIKDRQKYSREYIKSLQAVRDERKAELTAEKEAIKLLEQQAKALQGVARAEVERQIAARQTELYRKGGLEQSVSNQIRDTERLVRAEMDRLAALEKIERKGNAMTSLFSRLNGTMDFRPALQATRSLLDQANKDFEQVGKNLGRSLTRAYINEIRSIQANPLGSGGALSSEQIKSIDQLKQSVQQLRRAGSLNEILKVDRGNLSSLDQVRDRIKSVRSDLNDLRSIGLGNLAPSQLSQFADLRKEYTALRRLQSELSRVSKLDLSTESARKEVQQLTNDIKQLQKEMSQAGRVGRFMQGFGFALTPEMLGMSAFSTVMGALQRLGAAFIEVNAQSETMIRGLNAVFGEGMGDVKFENLVGLANQYGLAIQDLSRNYLQLSASTKGTILEGQESEKIFKSLSAAMAVLGADTITTNRAFRAVGQMISKGQVYAEELKGQLAEALPGAIQLFAKSMGKTTQEFLAMVKAGQVGLNELIPFFAEVERNYGAMAVSSTTWEQATNRLSNAWTILLKNIGDTGIWKTLVGLMGEVGVAAQSLADTIPSIDKEIKSFIRELENKTINIKLAFNLDTNIGDGRIFNEVGKGFEVIGNSLKDQALNFAPVIGNLRSANSLLDTFISLTEKLRGEKVDGVIDVKPINLDSIKQSAKLTREEFESQFATAIDDGYTYEFYERVYEAESKSYEKRIETAKRFNQEIIDLNSRRLYEQYRDEREYEDRRLKNSQASATVSENTNLNQRLVITKQLLRQEKVLLDIQQQSQYTLQSIEATQTSRELKSKGIADSLVTEYNNTQSLLKAYEAIDKSSALRNRFGDDVNPEQLKQIRDLQIDQLKYAERVARTANNHKLVLSIMQQQAELQKENIDATTQQIDTTKILNNEVVDGIRNSESALRKSSTTGLGLSNSILRALSATEQHNRLLSQQAALIAKSAQQQRELTWEFRDAKDQAEANAKAIRQSQQEQGQWLTPEYEAASKKQRRAQEAFAAAEEAFAKIRKSNNTEEIAELNRIVDANLKVAQSAFVDAGYAYGVDKVKNLREEVVRLEEAANKANIAQQQTQLDEILKASTPEQIKAQFDQLNASLREQVAIKEKAAADAKKATEAGNKAEAKSFEELADKAAREINRLVKARDLARDAYQQGVDTGQFKAIEIDASIKEQPVKDQFNKLREDLQNKANEKPIELGLRLIPDGVREKANEVYGYFRNAADLRVGSPDFTTAQQAFDAFVKVITESQPITIDPTQAIQTLSLIKVRLDQLKQSSVIPVRFDVQDAQGFLRTAGQGISAAQPLTYYVTVEGDQELQNVKTTFTDIRELIKTLPDGKFTIQGVDDAYNIVRVLQGIKQNGDIELLNATNAARDGAKAGEAAGKAYNESWRKYSSATGDEISRQMEVARREGQRTMAAAIVAPKLTFNEPQIQGEVQRQAGTISSELQSALNQQGVKVAIEDVKQTDVDGWQRNLKRLTATGPGLDFPIKGFQVQANTWEGIVAEGNRYMKLRAQIEVDPEFAKKVQEVKPIIQPEVKPNAVYQEVQQQLNAPISVTFEAQNAVGQIQSELAALQQSGATNIQVSLDNTTGKLVVEANVDPANEATMNLVQRIESMSPVLTVKVRYVDSGAPSSAESVTPEGKFATGGLIPGGYSRRDSYLAMLSPGEFVIPSNIVKKFGPDYFYDFIKNKRPSLRDNVSIPRFSNGGMMSAGQPIVINVGGSSIHLSGSRDAAAQLAKVLTRTGRAL
jgi:tape measure domain-containing protein